MKGEKLRVGMTNAKGIQIFQIFSKIYIRNKKMSERDIRALQLV